ncbi:DUF11 domain-containing protein [Candidatus Daviesbacteria bacterium]|nr:DUF11 domain-containing protein [Candidatus Daviesbacteria bacterium]
MNKVLISSFLLALFLITVPSAFADSGTTCTGQYGAYGATCQTTSLSVSKLIKNPVTGELVDTLSSSGPHFLPEQTVNFRVTVKNTGNTDLTNIQVQDKFPDFTDFVSGPGSFDSNSRAENFSIDKLKPGEFRDFDIVGKIKNAASMATNSLSCVTNFAQASVSNQNASDTALFCIENQILVTTTVLPRTGPADTALVLFGSFAMLIVSAFMFKKARA